MVLEQQQSLQYLFITHFLKKCLVDSLELISFFVISGFLISQIIIKQVQKQKFSYLNFYSRRIKRIYPALIIVLVFTLVIICKFKQFDLFIFSINTLDSSLIFATNIQILTHEKGYFDADIRGNPLLHLWSLGVEQQFYIIWPFMLTIILTSFRKYTLYILSGYTIISFIFSIIALNINPKFAFYFPICRFWQMSVGGILGYLNLTIVNKIINNTLSFVGLACILITVWLINDQSMFPGFWALIPTFCCAFLIQAKNQSLINKYIFSSRPFVFIGKISYSLYLWHWPLLVYSRVMYPAGSSSLFANTYFMIFLTFLFTILTYFIAQDPIRKMTNKKIVVVLLVVMALVGIASIPIRVIRENKYYDKNNYEAIQLIKQAQIGMVPDRQDYVTVGNKTYPNFSYNKNRVKPSDVMKIKSPKIDEEYDQSRGGFMMLQQSVQDGHNKYLPMVFTQQKQSGINIFQMIEGNDNQLFIIGDSHPMKMAYRFNELHKIYQKQDKLNKYPTVLLALKTGNMFQWNNQLLQFTRKLVHNYKPDRILLGWNWLLYLCKDLKSPLSQQADCDQQLMKQMMNDYVKFIHELQSYGVKVYSIGVDINYMQLNPLNMIDQDGVIQENIKPFKYSQYRNKYKVVYQYIQNYLTANSIKWRDTAQNLCWQDVCHVVSPKGWGGYVDIDHMGKFYSKHWFTLFDDLVEF